MQFSKIVKDERVRQGLSQKQLAEAAGVTQRAIYYWENGERHMTVESADKVFKALHISVRIGEKRGEKRRVYEAGSI